MYKRLPPLNSLKAFECSARHLSFTKASEELCVTQAAISHQIKLLEDFLGTPLFYRKNRTLELTEIGVHYFADISKIFNRLTEATKKILVQKNDKHLVIAVPQTFGIEWLVPHLNDFHHIHQNIDLRLNGVDQDEGFFKNDETWSVSRAFARQEVYNPQSMLYVDEAPLYPTVREAVDMVHRCGGMAVLAHMYEYAQSAKLRQRLDEVCAETGLDGLECAHSSFTPEQIQGLEAFCDARGFMKSGGSDYHGARKPGIELGTGRGQLHIKEEYLSSWKKVTYLQA